MSADLQWMIIRNTNSYLVKKRNISKPFNKHPHNLTNLHSFKYDGLVRDKFVAIEPAPGNKGIVLVSKKSKLRYKPAKSLHRETIKHGARRSLCSVRNFFRHGYRKDLKLHALRRASAVMRSQRTIIFKKKKGAQARKKAD
ncbi:60S ribosomal protein L28 [Chamberlinius hualienensis]